MSLPMIATTPPMSPDATLVHGGAFASETGLSAEGLPSFGELLDLSLTKRQLTPELSEEGAALPFESGKDLPGGNLLQPAVAGLAETAALLPSSPATPEMVAPQSDLAPSEAASDLAVLAESPVHVASAATQFAIMPIQPPLHTPAPGEELSSAEEARQPQPESPPAHGLRRQIAERSTAPVGIAIAELRTAQREPTPGSPAAPSEFTLPGDMPQPDVLAAAKPAETAPVPARIELPALAVPVQPSVQSPVAGSFASILAPEQAAKLEAVIDNFFSARESSRAVRGEVTLRHAEFGAIALQIERSDSDLRATLSSRDPGFAPAAQAALAERMVVASSESQAGGQRNPDSFTGQGQPREFGTGTQPDQRGANPGHTANRDDRAMPNPSGSSTLEGPEDRAETIRHDTTVNGLRFA